MNYFDKWDPVQDALDRGYSSLKEKWETDIIAGEICGWHCARMRERYYRERKKNETNSDAAN